MVAIESMVNVSCGNIGGRVLHLKAFVIGAASSLSESLLNNIKYEICIILRCCRKNDNLKQARHLFEEVEAPRPQLELLLRRLEVYQRLVQIEDERQLVLLPSLLIHLWQYVCHPWRLLRQL